MLYLTTPSNPAVREEMRRGRIGAMMNPGDGKTADLLAGISFALDNGCFTDPEGFEGPWRASLERRLPDRQRCLFAVVPDVVGDAGATRARWDRWAPEVRALGYRLAYVAQDGLDLAEVPWPDLDVWFTGGSTEWKTSDLAFAAAAEAKARGKWAHMGRVNSARKLKVAAAWGYDSADGTLMRYGPDIYLPRILRWLDGVDAERSLWQAG